MNFRKFLQKLYFRYQRYAPQNIMMYIIGGMALVYLADMMLSMSAGATLSELFAFYRPYVLKGQVWRLITFIFIPPTSSLLYIVFTLYFYYLIGTTLEREWGSFWFDIYYLFGIIGAIAAGFISGYATNYYLNMSLFFAFACMYPDHQVLLFFFIPIKIKWLALLDGALFLYSFIFSDWAGRAAIIAALANFLLFFGPSFINGIKNSISDARRRQKFQSEYDKGRRDSWK